MRRGPAALLIELIPWLPAPTWAPRPPGPSAPSPSEAELLAGQEPSSLGLRPWASRSLEPMSPRVPSLLSPDRSPLTRRGTPGASCLDATNRPRSYPHRLWCPPGPPSPSRSPGSQPATAAPPPPPGSVHILCLHWLLSPPLHLPHPHRPQPRLRKLHFRFSKRQPRVSPQGPAQPGHQLIKDLQQDVGITGKPGSGSAGAEGQVLSLGLPAPPSCQVPRGAEPLRPSWGLHRSLGSG